MVAGMVKGFGMTMDYVLYELSYANLIMLSATLPSYNTDKDNANSEEETLDMSQPEDQKKIDALLGIGGEE